MLNIDEMKLYLRVDGSEEDEMINSLIEYSKEEIKDATGAAMEDYGDSEVYKMLQKIIITDRYENRSSTDGEWKVNNIYSSLCTKLKARVEEDEDISQ